MAANLFLIGDTHFGHGKIAALRGFGNEEAPDVLAHDEYLIERWNSVVRQKDIIYHLGDVAFHNFECLKTLKGYKKLILGNHDNWEKLSIYFNRCYGALAFRRSIITHIPVYPKQLEHRFKFNLHGHTHQHNLEDPRYINLSAEQLDLTPIAIEDLQKRFEEKI